MTDQQPAVVDAERFAVTRTIRIAAPPAKVWQALTHDDHIAAWFGQRASLPERRVGGEGTFGFDGWGDLPVRIDEYDEPRVFAYTWGTPGQPLNDQTATQVRFTLVPDAVGTELTVVETGFDSLTSRDVTAAMEDNRQGWTAELDELVAYLEGVA